MKYKHLRIIDRFDIRLANYTLSRDCSALFRKNYKSYSAIAINIFRNSPGIQRLVLVINENIMTLIKKSEGINKLNFYIAKTRPLKKGNMYRASGMLIVFTYEKKTPLES